jgi:signal transduction histidine kinase/ligand-binding sensor domain-containing protein
MLAPQRHGRDRLATRSTLQGLGHRFGVSGMSARQQSRYAGWRQRCCAWLLAVLVPSAALAVDPDVRLADLHRREWTRLQGAPADMTDLMLAADGMLWLAGNAGVYRFDGVRFHRFEPASGEALDGASINASAADRDGSLWLMRTTGELLHLRGNTVRSWERDKAVQSGVPTDLEIDGEGRVWAITKSGLSVLTDGTWRSVGEADGVSGGNVDSIEIADDGRIWVLSAGGIFSSDFHKIKFKLEEALTPGTHPTRLMLGPRGEVWRSSPVAQEDFCRLLPRERRGCWKAGSVLNPKIDAQGALWWTSSQGGLWRVARPSQLGSDPGEMTRVAERLDVDGEYFAFAADGSVWTSTANTLTRLRQVPFQPVPVPTGALAAASDATVWLGSFTRGLMRVGVPPAGTPLLQGDDGTLWTAAAAAASADLAQTMKFAPLAGTPRAGTPVVLARYPEAQGYSTVRLDPMPGGGVRLATLSPPRLVAHDGSHAREIALPALDRGSLLRGITQDAQGELWIAAARNAVPFWRLHEGQWLAYGGISGVDSNAINALTIAGAETWIAIGANQVGRIRDSRWTRYGPGDGLALGQAINIVVQHEQVWVAGLSGLQLRQGERFVPLIGSDGDRFGGGSGMLALENGDLWLNGTQGISRIRREEWQRALREPDYRVAYTRIDYLDGNLSGAIKGAPVPALARSSDGLLWAATETALLRLDPARLPPPVAAPRVQLLSFKVDGVARDVSQPLALPVGAARLALTFAVPPIDIPERVRLRYRLQASGEWTEAGDRREVLYEALAPGSHVFEVVASDSEGRWSETPTQVGFTLPPPFHQTYAFRLLLAAAVALLLAGLYAMRMRQVAARIRRETTTRLHERMRISRDLHDTLLQSVQALHMNVQAIAARVPEDDPLSQRIALVLERAQDAIREGRDRLSALRDPLAGTSDLAETLQRIAQRLAREADVLCDVQFDTPRRALQPDTYDELLHIGREALANALQHAQATRVTLRVAFEDEGVEISISDDGGGFPGEVLAEGGRDGHFGLRGMRERAAQAGGRLQVRNRAGGGAEVVIRVPAARAYIEPAMARRWFRHDAPLVTESPD